MLVKPIGSEYTSAKVWLVPVPEEGVTETAVGGSTDPNVNLATKADRLPPLLD